MLREFEELSYRQISEITALPIGTVMSRLARAKGVRGCLPARDKEELLNRRRTSARIQIETPPAIESGSHWRLRRGRVNAPALKPALRRE